MGEKGQYDILSCAQPLNREKGDGSVSALSLFVYVSKVLLVDRPLYECPVYLARLMESCIVTRERKK